MGALSLRLPDALERQLTQEASLSGVPRSQLIREALEALLVQRRRERAEAALVAAAQALAADPAAQQEALEMAAAFLLAENEGLAAAEGRSSDAASGMPWWR